MVADLYPWLITDYNNLLGLMNRLPQSLLIYGQEGLGHNILIRRYIELLLCQDIPLSVNQTALKYACCKCQACVLLEHNNHPDFYHLKQIDTSSEIKNISIVDIRAMIDFVWTKPSFSKYKIVLITPMEALNISSSNALLKILEEPPAHAIFILQATDIANILPTIKSRCYKYRLSIPHIDQIAAYKELIDKEDYQFWLNYYDNAPFFVTEVTKPQLSLLIALFLHPSIESIFLVSEEFDGRKISFNFILKFFLHWLHDLSSVALGAKAKYFFEYEEKFKMILPMLNIVNLFYLYDRVCVLLAWVNHPLNYKMQVINLFLQYQGLFVSNPDK